MHVLIVDDSRAQRLLIRKVVGPLCDETSQAANGVEALKVLEDTFANDNPVDVALVDWNMPEMDGIDFVRAVRAESRYSQLRVIMVTTESAADRVFEALGDGADAFITKPVSKEKVQPKLKAG